ncbi:MAG: hypothetical protein Q4D98_13915 [Planctomycetia bacterium]|nr:hypothetical protein [Planctomycetia bacterium]
MTRESDGSFLTRDFGDLEAMKKVFQQCGTDNCSIHKELRKQPSFVGLIGPLEEGPNIIRYESPEVFEVLTREWVAAVPVTRRRKKTGYMP